MNILKKFWEWLVMSSADAQKISLTVKAFLIGLIPGILFLTNMLNVQFDSETFTGIVEAVAQIIVLLGGLITAIAFVWGAVRKLLTTLTGKNAVVVGWGK